MELGLDRLSFNMVGVGVYICIEMIPWLRVGLWAYDRDCIALIACQNRHCFQRSFSFSVFYPSFLIRTHHIFKTAPCQVTTEEGKSDGRKTIPRIRGHVFCSKNCGLPGLPPPREGGGTI
jgi:hypothetical protein